MKSDENDNHNHSELNSNKFSLSKTDLELFDEEKAGKVAPIIRVKRVVSPTKDEKWKIMQNNELLFTVEGQRLSKKERAFLQTLEGVSFLIRVSKEGIKSISDLKKKIKDELH